MEEMAIAICWVLLCTFLVCIMQVGFLWLEAGLVRKKNAINVAVKNMADFCVSAALFWAVGFGVMFGASSGGVLGFTQHFFSDTDPWTQVFFFFQLAFCGTAITIVSGAVAERMTFFGYLAAAALGAGLVYPVFGHWAWGGLLSGEASGWLEKMGFIDFAGSTVVHSVGGWMALAAVLVIGPRLGRFGRRRNAIKPSDLTLSISGCFLLWIGWFGFNGGSVLALDETVPGVLLNTLMAPAAGAIAIIALTITGNRQIGVPDIVNGVLAGLVAITANCHLVTITEAFIIGAVGGWASYGGRLLLERMKIDDAVSAIPVHLIAGIWGTLAVAIFGDLEAFGGASRLQQFGVQATGVIAAGAYAFGVAYVVLSAIHRIRPMRVTAREELGGLNVSEHHEHSPMQVLMEKMEQQAHSGDFSRPVYVERFTEAGAVAAGYNRVLARVRHEENEKRAALESASAAQRAAETASMAKSQFLSTISHEFRTPLNAILNFSRLLNMQQAGREVPPEQAEFLKHIESSGAHLLGLIDQVLKFTSIEAEKFELNESGFDLGKLVGETLDYYATRIAESGLTYTASVAPDLPELFADRDAVRQTLLNLLANAIQHTPKGGHITVSAYMTSDGQINLTVKDTGKGLSAADLKMVTTPFAQVVKPGGTPPSGLGLGLTLAQALTEAHQGDFFLRSEPGQGLEVFIRFPAARSYADEGARKAS